MNADTDKLGKIYFISEAMHTPDTSDDDILDDIDITYETCYKIGFSSNLKKRLISYASDTPRFSVHFTIDNATEEDEKRLHKYFSKYSREDLNGREWFIKNKEMVKFFREHKTIEEIRSAIPELKISDKMVEKTRILITPVINIMTENEIGYKKEDFKNESDYVISKSLLDKYVSNTQYYENIGEFMDFLKSNGDIGEDEFELILSKLKECKIIEEDLKKFNSIPAYEHRMRYVCELGKILDKDKFNLFLNFIPVSFKKYYTILGSKKLKSIGYQKFMIEKEFDKIIKASGTKDRLREIILSTFNVGERYTRNYVKATLTEIYKSLGRDQTAKANDIEKWFEVKLVKIKNPSNPDPNKREHGFELLDLKS